jgi:predicted phosphodiesterase
MTPLIESIPLDVHPLEQLIALRNMLRRRAYRRLTQAFETARSIFFDDDSRLVFFSDLHRGDNSRSDAFAQNEDLFLQALRHYFREGFTYIEVGDGDELWQNRRLSSVKRAHRPTFDLLHTFAVHGHQVDFKSDALYHVSRFVIRHFWRHVQNLGLGDVASSIAESRNRGTLRQRVSEWIEAHKQMVICGHTHTPKFPEPGALPYFNTGSGVFDGYITGLEIQNGQIALVKWLQSGLGQAERWLVAPPRRLSLAT